MISIEQLSRQFTERFGGAPRVFSAPGRVNLIGEHTDYNDGFVLPMAIDRRTVVAGAAREGRRVRCLSLDFDGLAEFHLDESLRPAGDWSDYVRGVAAHLLRNGAALQGADLLIASDVPVGAGLSSSAALEVASGFALLQLAAQPLAPLALALAAQQAEWEFAGTHCGIMDQFIATHAVEGRALLLDCRSLEFRAVPLADDRVRVVVCNSMVKHNLAGSEYNRRRAECAEGVRRLAAWLPGIQSLRDVSIEDFDPFAGALPPVIRRRCNHVITENARTLAAVSSLEAGNLAAFGRLMYASHESLRLDYDVSCPELDLLVELTRPLAGVYGARMTGGGFGGCTVQLVAAAEVEPFTSTLSRRYREQTGLQPEIYVCLASGGVREDTEKMCDR
jgi:galactokinase